jgi:ADP-heptose:LPS heptosyltransferase
MILHLWGSLGDHVIMTGIPEAYFKIFGEQTKIIDKHSDLFWNNNPYITEESIGKDYYFNANTVDTYQYYYPQRVFHDITGLWVDREDVQPNLYIPRKTIPKLVIMNDQAGWPSRRGYRYLTNLSIRLMENGYIVAYLRNTGFKDCTNKVSAGQIWKYSYILENLPMPQLVDKLSEAALYIGYDSGISAIVGAFKIPYITFYGSIPAINTTHFTCIYAIDECDHCCTDQCNKNCLTLYEDKTDEIMERIKAHGI